MRLLEQLRSLLGPLVGDVGLGPRDGAFSKLAGCEEAKEEEEETVGPCTYDIVAQGATCTMTGISNACCTASQAWDATAMTTDCTTEDAAASSAQMATGCDWR